MKRRGSGAGRRDEAEFGQCLDPAWRVSLNAQRLVIGGAVAVRFATLEHEEDGSQDLVADGDDCAFMAASDDQGLEFRFENGSGAAGGVSELAQQAPDVAVATAHVAGIGVFPLIHRCPGRPLPMRPDDQHCQRPPYRCQCTDPAEPAQVGQYYTGANT